MTTCWNCWNLIDENICPYCEEIQNEIKLEFVKRTDLRYQQIRDRHYIPNRGTHGQQIHFVIHYNNMVIGIISGASSVYGVKTRDEFFNIPNNKYIKEKYYLPAIINNTVFRLEYHEKNLATKVLSKFRKVVVDLWEQMYNIPVIGFETFVVETDYRKGTLYKADNWTYVGNTAGSTKSHNGMNTPSTRHNTDIKMIYCKWIKNKPVNPTVEYKSSWKAETLEEKQRAKRIVNLKKELVGVCFN